MAAAAAVVASAVMTTSRSDPAPPGGTPARQSARRVAFARPRVTLMAVALAAAASGCTYTVRLLSDPSGASVTWWEDGVIREQLVTPAELTVPRKASGHVWLAFEAPGYRPLQIDLQRTEGPLLRYIGAATLQRGGREVKVLLEPDRPPVGSE